MPVSLNKDRKGYYFQFGTIGKKYYFNIKSEDSMDFAYHKAAKQGAVIHLKQYLRNKSKIRSK